MPVMDLSGWCFTCSVCVLHQYTAARAMQKHSAEPGILSALFGLHYLLQNIVRTRFLCAIEAWLGDVHETDLNASNIIYFH